MIVKLAVLGAIGYAGYRFYQMNKETRSSPSSSSQPGAEPDLSDPQVALAGGPLSTEAALRHAGQPLSPA